MGSGGREDALAWRLRQSPSCGKLVAAPGNPGIARWAECMALDPCDPSAVVELARTEGIDLVVVGPEAPLVAGVADALREAGIAVFGPSAAAAQLEGSKGFTKDLCRANGIPTADYVRVERAEDARAALGRFGIPVVIKADGLAAGKGVTVAMSVEEARQAIDEAGDGPLVIEEFLEGEELSFLCLSDGKHVTPLVPAQDHKRIGEGDTGPNTGGMGVYSTSQMLEPTMTDWILHHIAEPTVRGMAEENTPFTGVLYCGLMMTAKGPQVLEYNARFGDPETQAILVRLESDLVDALEAAIDGRLSETALRWASGASACVIASSSGYPGSYKTGLPISGLGAAAQIPGVEVFHSGTAEDGGQIVTNGGRVLGVTAAGDSLEQALGRAYDAIAQIKFDGIYYRRDIGHRALRKSH